MSNLFCLASSFFPLSSPVPLAAPASVFKALLLVTSSLHFIAVEMLVGGLMLAVLLNGFAQSSSRYTFRGELLRSSANIFSKRLTIVMTYVVNFAIPPLLFVQVLYGQALYTSSILVGAYWFAIILILMLAYWLLYKFADRCALGYSGLFHGIVAWVCIGIIGKILTVNMTLMMNPDVWETMYKNGPAGILLPPIDPCVLGRWVFMVVGAVVASGLWAIWLGGKRNNTLQIRSYLSNLGNKMVFWGIPFHILAGCWLWSLQSDIVKAGIQEPGLGTAGIAVWLFTYGILWMIAWCKIYMFNFAQKKFVNSGMCLLGCISIFAIVFVRSSVRDITLSSKGFFDVASLPAIQTNFLVLGIFLFLFALGVAVVMCLVSVCVGVKTSTDEIQIPLSRNISESVDSEQIKSAVSGLQVSRRKFLAPTILALGTVYLGGTSYATYRYIENCVTGKKKNQTNMPSEILLKDAQNLPKASAMEFSFLGHGALLIRHADDTWTAYSSVCTHQGCKVRYEADKDIIFCPCHSGEFNSKNGSPLSGPPKSPLPGYEVKLVDNDIIVRS